MTTAQPKPHTDGVRFRHLRRFSLTLLAVTAMIAGQRMPIVGWRLLEPNRYPSVAMPFIEGVRSVNKSHSICACFGREVVG